MCNKECCGKCVNFEAYYSKFMSFAGKEIFIGKCVIHPEMMAEEGLFETCVPCNDYTK